MTGATHASIGAALGALIKKPGLAFLAGAASHLIADILPHRDYTIKTEVAMMAAAVGAIALRYGLDSPEFWGAIGAIAPDFEHGFTELGIVPRSWECFPTHIHDGKYHGPDSGERISQMIVAVASLLVAEVANRRTGGAVPTTDER